MNCRYVQSKLAAYIDRELSRDETASVRVHLHECAQCELEQVELVRLKEQIGSLPAVEPSEDFETRLFSAVYNSPLADTKSRFLDWRFALIPASAVAAAYMFFVISREDPNLREPAPMISQNNSLARDQAFDQARNPFSGNTTVSFDAPTGR